MSTLLLIVSVLLFAAVLMVPLAVEMKLGSVLGYILAGIFLGPFLTAMDIDIVMLQHFSEFGVVMMLFLVGLELAPKQLWEMRHRLIGLGGIQVVATVMIVAAIGHALGLAPSVAIAVGLVFSLSSTAIVLQTLNERRLMPTEGGRSSFSVLLFQDIAVIPMLAMIPLLASLGKGAASSAPVGPSHHELSLVYGLPGWQQALVTATAIVVVVFVGITLIRPLFRYAASTRMREILVAAALLLVVGIALLMQLVELSPALGTFLAGVVLANSEYRHELESNLDPFKGLLLGLFFMTVGASIDFSLMFEKITVVVAGAVGIMTLKAGILFVLAGGFSLRSRDRWILTLSLSQVGEFAFVLLGFMVSEGVITSEFSSLLLLMVATSMILTPVLFLIGDRFLFREEEPDRVADEIEETASILIAGHGRFGGVVNRMLRGLGFKATVLDYNYDQLEILRKYKLRAYFGDATRADLLIAAGIERAKLFVVALDQKESITMLTEYVCRNYPKIHVIARAVDRHHVYELYEAGCRDIIRETFDSSTRAGRSALEALGMSHEDAVRKTHQFIELDQHAMRELAPLYRTDIPAHENPEYVQKALEMRVMSEEMLQGDCHELKDSSVQRTSG